MLTTLTNEEERLMTIVGQQVGSMEAKHQALERLGIFIAYATIHEAYADLAGTTNTLEAAKRAIFLQWSATTEPACFTGIFKLHAQAEQHVVKCLNRHIMNDTLDPESKAMLRWYYSISDYYFEQFPQQIGLRTYLQQHRDVHMVRDTIDTVDLQRRGQMGIYWFSLLYNRQ